jgi:DNA-binding transcriptional MerR regulator
LDAVTKSRRRDSSDNCPQCNAMRRCVRDIEFFCLTLPLGEAVSYETTAGNQRCERRSLDRRKQVAMYTIGQFSKITGFTVKTLRFYHEKGLLVPPCVDHDTGYRYYNAESAERGRIIAGLRGLGFSVAEMADILRNCEDEADLIEYLHDRRMTISQRIRDDQKVLSQLDDIISNEREARTMADKATFQIEEKDVPAMCIAGVRMKGKYEDCGKGFALLGRRVGRYACGKPMNLYYDGEYREDDADMEPCFPVIPTAKSSPDIVIRELPGGRCVSLLHKGPYDQLGRSYEKLFAHIEKQGYRTLLPSREVYLKGPGMIFRGNPAKYLTELQIFIEQ